MKKRIISLLLAVVMIVSMFPATTVWANTEHSEASIAVDATWTNPGSTVDVDLVIADNPGILGARLTVSWDERLTLIADKSGLAFVDLIYTPPGKYSPSGTNFVWTNTTTILPLNGDILTLTFQVPEDLKNNDILPIHVTYTPGDVVDRNGRDVTLHITNGQVRVITYTPGDVNGDSRINVLDAIHLSQYISDGCKTVPDSYNVVVIEDACDVTGDGIINPSDLIRLRQYISDGFIVDPLGYNAVLYPAKFVCPHYDLTAIAAKEPTCTEEGNIAYWYCNDCEKYFKDAEAAVEIKYENTVIPTTGHTEVIDKAVEATCTETGLTEGRHCSVCNAILQKQKVVPAKGHAYGPDATCTEPQTCAVCGEMLDPAKGHTEVIDKAVEATCTETGLTEGKHCSVCNAILQKQEVVPAKGHTYGPDATCTEPQTCAVCGEMFDPAKGHAEVIDKAVEATCTETGLTEGKHCSVCEAILQKQEVVPAKGHTEVIDKAVEATCTETGLTEGKHCSVCEAILQKQEVVPAKGHNLIVTEAKAPTCTVNGNRLYWHCTRCNEYFSNAEATVEITYDDTVIPTVGHNMRETASKEPTCAEDGNIAYWYCTRCTKYFDNQDATWELAYEDTVLPATGRHSEYSIVYDIAGSDAYLAKQTIHNPNPKSYCGKCTTTVLEDLTAPAGYEFLGWYDAGRNLITEIPKGSTGNKTLYAHWKEVVYNITYETYQTPLDDIKDETYCQYTVSKGLKNLPNPVIRNYVFLGWYNKAGEEVTEIAPGTTEDISLYPYLTSKRNLTKAVPSLEDPIILEDSDKGVIYFTYELGKIENVPLSEPFWTIQSVHGLAQQASTTFSRSISEENALEIADTISKSTVDSATWTLSSGWNKETSATKEWASEHGMTVEEANEWTKTESDTYSFTTDTGGYDTITVTDGITAVEYHSQDYTHGNSVELNTKVSGKYSTDAKAGITLEGLVDIGGSTKWEVSSESGVGYNKHEQWSEHTGTENTTIHSTVTESGTSWNNSETSSQTKEASQSESVKQALSEIISETKGYGISYSSVGNNSESKGFSSTDSQSVSSSSTLTYFTSETSTTTTTYSTTGMTEGCYRLVLAGTVHVFGVVGFDIATNSYFTYTFNVLDDKTYEFLDYSPSLNFNDYENGALPFEIPYFVHEYVTSKIAVTESITYVTDSAKGTATVINFGENMGTEDVPNWVYPTKDVVIPSYVTSGGNVYKVTGISANAFAGKPIRSIILGDYITEIPANAFKDCTELEQISGRFTSIGDNAFSGCTKLEGFIVSPRTTEIGENAFYEVNNIKMYALHEKFAPKDHVAEATQEVIRSAVNSGAKNVAVDISKIAPGTVLTVDVPEMDSFGLIGGKKVNYTDLKVTSLAKITKLRDLTVEHCTRIPLDIKAGDLILDTVHITAPHLVLLAEKDGATISLLRDNRLTSEVGHAVVAKNPQIKSPMDESVWGKLTVSGHFYYCGSKPDTSNITMSKGELIELNEAEFESYIRGYFKITLDPNGGTVDTTEMTGFIGMPLGELPVPTRTGFDFAGWFDSHNDQITEASAFATLLDVTLTAKWSPKVYTATWNTGTGYTIAVKRTSSPYHGAATGTLRNGEKVYFGDELSVTYTANTGYALDSKGKTFIIVIGNVTSFDIYASASLIRYTVTLIGNGGTVSPKTIQVTYGNRYDSLGQKLPIPVRSGHQFTGWKNLTTGKIVNDAYIVDCANDHTLEAQWTAYSISLVDEDGRTPMSGNAKIDANGKYTGLPTPTRSGSVFLGWYYNDKKVENGMKIAVEWSHALSAKWVKYSHTVTLRSGNSGAREIIETGGYYDYIEPGFDRSRLLECGYKTLKIKITYNVKEEREGYQHLFVDSWEKKQIVAADKFSHGGVGINNNWKTYVFECQIAISSATVNGYGAFYLEWGASGVKPNNWFVGETTVNITAVK